MMRKSNKQKANMVQILTRVSFFFLAPQVNDVPKAGESVFIMCVMLAKYSLEYLHPECPAHTSP